MQRRTRDNATRPRTPAAQSVATRGVVGVSVVQCTPDESVHQSPRQVVQREALGRAFGPVIQRKENEMATKTHAWPTMLQEIKQQYQPPDGALDALWTQGELQAINEKQVGGMPYHSTAKLSQLDKTGKRPSNPTSVTVHGDIGNREAILRAGIKGEPYDGGHLIAYNFMAGKANVFENVAPQGKKLNNGPFSLWEDQVLGKAVEATSKLLAQHNVPPERIPHTYEYSVFVSYTWEHYEVPAQKLVDEKMVPATHAAQLPKSFWFIKRIPLHWSANAIPLALPSSAELGIAERPNTPFLLDKTADYGIKGHRAANQNFSARGPKELVDQRNYGVGGQLSEGTTLKIARTVGGLQKNKQLAPFERLTSDKAGVEWLLNPSQGQGTFTFEELNAVRLALSMPSSKLFKGDPVFTVINSNYKADKITLSPQQVEGAFKAILAKQDPGVDKEALIQVINATLTLKGTTTNIQEEVAKSKEAESSPKLVDVKAVEPNYHDANQLDFTGPEQLSAQQSKLPEHSVLSFEADDTQP